MQYVPATHLDAIGSFMLTSNVAALWSSSSLTVYVFLLVEWGGEEYPNHLPVISELNYLDLFD